MTGLAPGEVMTGMPGLVAVAVLPALAAALVIFRRPDPAAELRAAEIA